MPFPSSSVIVSDSFSPMLATAWNELSLETGDWSFEVKYDGIRAMMIIDQSGVRIFSRSGRDISDKYPEIVDSATKNKDYHTIILDGEIIAVDDDGLPSFQGLQSRMNLDSTVKIMERVDSVPVQFVVFDLPVLWVNSSRDVKFQIRPSDPWIERRDMLATLFENNVFNHPIAESPASRDADTMLHFATKHKLEGIMAQRHNSLYLSGVRSPNWMKLPFTTHIRAIVGGFTEGTGKRSDVFGGLVLGLYNDAGELVHIGSVGTGFNDITLNLMMQILDDRTTGNCPFMVKPQLAKKVTWVKPDLVVSVEFRNWTNGFHMRMPSYKGVTDESADIFEDVT